MMQTTTPEAIVTAKAQLERFTARVLHLFTFVPEDKLTWAPSTSSKSPLQIVAHCGVVNRFFAEVLTDRMPATMPSPQEFFGGLAAAESQIATRAEAVSLVQETAAELSAALDSLTPERLESLANSPFGPMPVRFWIAQGGEHMADHAGQLEYLQTIWGDLDNHYG